MKNTMKKVVYFSLACTLSATAMEQIERPRKQSSKALMDLLCPSCCWHCCDEKIGKPFDTAVMHACEPFFKYGSEACNNATQRWMEEEGALSDAFCNCATALAFKLTGAFMEEKPEVLRILAPLVASGVATAVITHRLELRRRTTQVPKTAAFMN